ncbi:MAG: hypothetical protein IKH57_01295, partial [Clostridia bacterium]|nr:hypothetical protein [Clostridia bacterium]
TFLSCTYPFQIKFVLDKGSTLLFALTAPSLALKPLISDALPILSTAQSDLTCFFHSWPPFRAAYFPVLFFAFSSDPILYSCFLSSFCLQFFVGLSLA